MQKALSAKKKSEKKSTEKEKNNSVKISFGVFFDGTLNSIGNINERKDFEKYSKSHESTKITEKRDKFYKGTGSYGNEYTNVARFYKCYKIKDDVIPIYVEGIGTKPRMIGQKVDFSQPIVENESHLTCSDDQIGSALGVGLFGVKKKVESACQKILNRIKNLKDLKKGTKLELKFYVFGFSRGSAAARCFSACLLKRLGTTKVESTFNTKVIGLFNGTRIKKLLEKENEYKTSLKADWLTEFIKKRNISLSNIKVEFLGLYDTVSSYGAYFDDDVNELSLKISSNVNKVFQICAGDEYRKNFALTDISSATGKGDYIIIPGAHSDIGGGYAQNMSEKIDSLLFTSGRKGYALLISEGWFKRNEEVRTISNLYSIIPFNLMKDKITGKDTVFTGSKLEKYVLPSSWQAKIDGILHQPSKELNDFFNKLKAGEYNSYYRLEGKTIKSLSKEEYDLTREIETNEMFIRCWDSEESSYMDEKNIAILEEKNKINRKNLDIVKQKKSKYDEDLLKQIRHDFLHLSAKSDEFLDIFVNKSDTNNNRTVIKG